MKLLLAEDTKDLSRALTAVLTHEGYEVEAVYDGQEALERINSESFDTVILDIMMPKKTGIEVVEEMRRVNDATPVLLLTAKAEIDDRVTGLDAGADDYLTKPFAMKELLARVRALARRKTKFAGKKLEFGDLWLTPEEFELTSENSVRLSVKEFELMQLLILQAEKPVKTEYIIDHVWENEEANADTVWLYISYLKSKLGSIGSNVFIEGEKNQEFTLKFST